MVSLSSKQQALLGSPAKGIQQTVIKSKFSQVTLYKNFIMAQNLNISHLEGEDGPAQHSPSPHRQPSPAGFPGILGAVLLSCQFWSNSWGCWQQMLIRAHPLVGEWLWLWYIRSCWIQPHFSASQRQNVQFLVKNKEFDGFIWHQQ